MSFAPNIQFYAGTPIITSSGFTVGILCITEKVPGILNHSQKNGLRLLSDQITNIIETGFTQSTPLVPRNEENETDIIHSNYYSLATILFTDFVGFTNLTEQIQPGELIETLDEFLSHLIRLWNYMV